MRTNVLEPDNKYVVICPFTCGREKARFKFSPGDVVMALGEINNCYRVRFNHKEYQVEKDKVYNFALLNDLSEEE